jgi:CheY-like chemotaxis protein
MKQILHDSPGTDRSETVLIVEDDVMVRFALAGYLRHCGYHVIERSGLGDRS